MESVAFPEGNRRCRDCFFVVQMMVLSYRIVVR
jgi:hypothetical protein